MPEQLTWENAEKTLVGKLTLVELQHVDARGKQLLLEHAYGTIASVDQKNGIFIDCQGIRTGTKLALPGELSPFKAARPGLYKLETTGEEIEDPDFFSTWTITHKDQLAV
ncbi:MAG TPA: hypothetical protein VG407_14760 [Caulobacteraceae bacterium]|nr:hypothetical protein [Caulobacteraceae bacterium]